MKASAMRWVVKIVIASLVAGLLSACVYNKAVPIGGNVWVMETDGRGALGAALVASSTMRDAATLTLQEGYTHFLLKEAPDRPQNIGVQAVLYGSTRTVTYAADIAPTVPAPDGRAPLVEAPGADPTLRTRVAVEMLARDDPRSAGAYDALKVLAANQ